MCHVCMMVIQDPKSLTIKPREKEMTCLNVAQFISEWYINCKASKPRISKMHNVQETQKLF